MELPKIEALPRLLVTPERFGDVLQDTVEIEPIILTDYPDLPETRRVYADGERTLERLDSTTI